jgi:prepilin-type N-terminal cleavage/methylation domain-containing protein
MNAAAEPRTGQSRRRAVTLVEFLVAMSVIAVVIAILAPSCMEARRAGMRTLCLTNLRQIGTAMGNHFNEHLDVFPWLAPCECDNDRRTNQTWFYGGRYPTHATDHVAAELRFEPQQRPFNGYLYPNCAGRTAELKLFKCPGDNGKHWVDPVAESATYEGHLCYLTTGSSYTCNWWWMWYSGLSKKAYGMAEELGRMPDYSTKMTRYKLSVRGASIFTVLYGDPLDAMIARRQPVRGWHDPTDQAPGWSEMLLLDGHADFIHTDTTEGYETRVTTWTTWWNTPAEQIPEQFKPPYPSIQEYERRSQR